MKKSLTLALIITTFYACKPNKKFPIEPEISQPRVMHLKDAAGKDTSVVLKFYFTDGDGDIGIDENDTTTGSNRNILVDYLVQKNGVLKINEKYKNAFSVRVPNLQNPEGLQVQGEIELKIDVSLSPDDTIQLDYRLRDKAKHLSNTLTTGLLVLKH